MHMLGMIEAKETTLAMTAHRLAINPSDEASDAINALETRMTPP